MQLRQYQIDDLNNINEAWKQERSVMYCLQTGGGKTAIACSLIKSLLAQGKKVVFIAHREELISQAFNTFFKHEIYCGIIKGGTKPNYSLPVQIGSIQSMVRRQLPPSDVVIIDECFVPGTLVDGVDIENIKIGDMVNCFDESSKSMTKSKVTRTFKNAYNRDLYRITSGWDKIICTDLHPVLTKEGWKEAKSISTNDKLLIYGLQNVRESNASNKKNMLKSVLHEGYVRENEQNESYSLLRPNEDKQSNGETGHPGQDEGFNEREKVCRTWRQREGIIGTSAIAIQSNKRDWWSNGVHTENGRSENKVQFASTLQDRSGYSIIQSCDRDRWNESQQSESSGCRQEKNTFTEWSRVDSVKVLEFGSDEWNREMRGENFVYNIEVETYHTYVANNIVVHNCHHALEDNTYGKVIEQWYPNALILGVTATPYRLNGKGFTRMFSTLVESCVTRRDLINMGFLVPMRYFAAWSPDMSHVEVSKGEYDQEQSIEAMELAPIVESYMDHCNGMAGIVFAVNVSHSKQIVNKYIDAGVPAAHIDADTPTEERRRVLQAFKEKRIKILSNVGIATEGFDMPNMDFAQLARPTLSLSLVSQMIGRAGRVDNETIKHCRDDEERRQAIAASQKPFGIILDNAGIYTKHLSLVTELTVGTPINWRRYYEGFTKKKKKAIDEFIEIEYIAEDEEGNRVVTKIPAEIEGMKLIEITEGHKEKIVSMASIGEFERTYEMFKRMPDKIEKPGYTAYLNFEKYCRNKNIAITEDIWKHLDQRLYRDHKHKIDSINEVKDKQISAILSMYPDDEKESNMLQNEVRGRVDKEINAINKLMVPSWFLKKKRAEMDATEPVTV